MRLNKYIAESGLCSRRKADELIFGGKVRADGVTVRTPGLDVPEGMKIEVDGHLIAPDKHKVYIAMNKPRGYITSVSDDKGRPTVLELLGDVEARVFPVGRLDYDTSGLLILTNDGDFAYRIAHPSGGSVKTYRAQVTGVLSRERIAKLRKGVDIGDHVTAPAKVELIKQSAAGAIVDISIHEGRNRQVRKMFAAVGNKVISLERTAIGDIKLGGLKPGHYRKLRREEIQGI